LTRVGSLKAPFPRRLSAKAIECGWLTNDGPPVRALEGRIADRLGFRLCSATCNSTLAMELAIRTLGLRNVATRNALFQDSDFGRTEAAMTSD
jgi:hypothetical protein